MLALLGLLGIGLLLSVIDDSDDDASGVVPGTGEDDLIADEAYRSVIDDIIEQEGELLGATSEQIAAAQAQVVYTDGSANVTGGAGDDSLFLGDGNDTILGGAGSDTVLGGPGDDLIELGEGDDFAGADAVFLIDQGIITPFPIRPVEGDESNVESDPFIEGGDDTVRGGAGTDLISDNYGSNTLIGNQGVDLINSVDAADDALTPDTVQGRFGGDVLLVDEGDEVTTGPGSDGVFVDVSNGPEAGYQQVVIEDFDIEQDRLVLVVDQAALAEAAVNPDLVNVTPNDDGSGALIAFDGIPVIEAIGAVGLTDDDVMLRVL